MKKADTAVVMAYALECARCTQDDCTFDEIQEALARTDMQNAALHLLDDDSVTVTADQQAAFGAVYRSELLALTLY